MRRIEMHAREIHAYKVHAHEIHAYEVHAHEMHAREMHAYLPRRHGWLPISAKLLVKVQLSSR
jgi:hypothetical protein